MAVGQRWRRRAPLAGLTTADTVHIDAASLIDASGAGSGGSVTIWSNADTSFLGRIVATGQRGGGGNAEVSGHGRYDFAGSADLRSADGGAGNLLLDPYNITISTAASANSTGFTAQASGATINTTALQNALATANVTVLTGSSGSENGDITVTSALTWSANTVLTLIAAGTGGIGGTGAIANAGALTFNVNNAAATGTLSGIISGAGSVTKTGAGMLTGADTYTGKTSVSAGTLVLAGALNVGAGGRKHRGRVGRDTVRHRDHHRRHPGA